MDIFYSTEKLCGHDELPTNKLHNAIVNQLASKHDELIFTALCDYGINRDNIGENVDRVERCAILSALFNTIWSKASELTKA